MLFLIALLALRVAPVVPSGMNRQPQLAVGGGSTALVFGSGESIWFAQSEDNGRNFSPLLKVAELRKLALGRHRGPRVAIAGNTVVITAISHESGDLSAWRSTDGGKTWSAPVVVNDQAQAAGEGLHAMVADSRGQIAVAWLDHRTAPGKKLYGAFSSDGGATWGKNVLLYESPAGSICECCHPSLTTVGPGEFAVMWRNQVDGFRDFYALRIRNGKPAGAAEKQGQGAWKLAACPMDGGGVAARGGLIVSAWRREHDIYYAEPGKPEVKLGPGHDVALATGKKGAYAIWTGEKGIELFSPGSAAHTPLAQGGAFPTIAALADGAMLAAWEESGSIALHRIE